MKIYKIIFIAGIVFVVLFTGLILDNIAFRKVLWNSGHYPDFMVKKWPEDVSAETLCKEGKYIISYQNDGAYLWCDAGEVYKNSKKI